MVSRDRVPLYLCLLSSHPRSSTMREKRWRRLLPRSFEYDRGIAVFFLLSSRDIVSLEAYFPSFSVSWPRAGLFFLVHEKKDLGYTPTGTSFPLFFYFPVPIDAYATGMYAMGVRSPSFLFLFLLLFIFPLRPREDRRHTCLPSFLQGTHQDAHRHEIECSA